MIHVAVGGGMITVADMRKLVEWCLTNGVRQIMPGLRQDLVLLDANERQIPSLQTCGFEPIPGGSFNIMSSLPTTGIESSLPWVNNAVYRRILEELPAHAPLRIQVQDPSQRLLTGLSSDLLFSAGKAVDTWNIYVYDAATKRLRIVNAICSTMQVAPIATLFAKRYGAQAPAVSFAEVQPLLHEHFGIARHPAQHEFRPLTAPTFEGMHKYSEGYWLGITARNGIFNPDTIQRVIGVAREAGTGYMFITPYHSLLLKNLPEASPGLASTLPLRHAEQELFWQSTPSALSLREQVSAALLQRQLPLKIPTAALTLGDHVEAALRLIRVRRLPLRLNLEITEQSQAGYEFSIRQYGSLRSLLPTIAFAEGTWQKIGPQLSTVVESNLTCPDCETTYIPEYGDPMAGVARGTAIGHLPEDYCCSVCGYVFNSESLRLNSKQVA